MPRSKTAKGRKLEQNEDARMRAEFFANGGVIKRYPSRLRGPNAHHLASSWGRGYLKRQRMLAEKKKKEEDGG